MAVGVRVSRDRRNEVYYEIGRNREKGKGMIIRLHWLSVFRRLYSQRMLIMLIGSSIVVFIAFPSWSILQYLFMLGTVGHTCFVLYCVLAWRLETLEFRDRMCILRSGVIIKEGKTIGYDSITDTQIVQSLIGRVLGYGSIRLILESREGTKELMLPYIAEVHAVSEMLEVKT